MKAFKELKDYAAKKLNHKNWYKMYLKVVSKIEIANNKVFRKKYVKETEEVLIDASMKLNTAEVLFQKPNDDLRVKKQESDKKEDLIQTIDDG